MIPYMFGKLAPNLTYSTGGLVKYVPGRGYFRAVFSQNGDKIITSPPPPQSLNGSLDIMVAYAVVREQNEGLLSPVCGEQT